MKNPMPKLYAMGTPEAVAALVCGAAFRGDESELKPLVLAVAGDSPRRERYAQRRNGLALASLAWAADCLRTRATMLALSSIITSGEASADEVIKADALHGAYKAKLAVLYAFMEKFADEVGLDMATIKPLAEADCVPPADNLPAPSTAAVEELLAVYRGLI